MCREHIPTAQFLIMQVFLQLFLVGKFTALFAKTQLFENTGNSKKEIIYQLAIFFKGFN